MNDTEKYLKNLEKQLKKAQKGMTAQMDRVQHISKLYTVKEQIVKDIKKHDFSLILTDNGTITINSTSNNAEQVKILYERIKKLK